MIVAEEVKTAHQGEVIGLFIEEKIERGMSLAETIAEIRRQGGLVYVPHPFDRLHSVPDYEHLLEVVERDRHPRGLQPADRDRLLQRGGGPLRAQVRHRPRRRLGQPRRPGPRQRQDPAARLRGARGVPGVDARRRHRPQAQEPRLRPGAEVPADQRRRGAAARSGGAAPARVDARARGRGRAEEEAGSRATDHRRRDPREVPGAGDTRAERPGPRPRRLRGLPARQRDAGAGLGPSPGRHLHAQAHGDARRRSRRASPSTAAPATP